MPNGDKNTIFFEILVFRLQGFPAPPRTTVEINRDGEGGAPARDHVDL